MGKMARVGGRFGAHRATRDGFTERTAPNV